MHRCDVPCEQKQRECASAQHQCQCTSVGCCCPSFAASPDFRKLSEPASASSLRKPGFDKLDTSGTRRRPLQGRFRPPGRLEVVVVLVGEGNLVRLLKLLCVLRDKKDVIESDLREEGWVEQDDGE